MPQCDWAKMSEREQDVLIHETLFGSTFTRGNQHRSEYYYYVGEEVEVVPYWTNSVGIAWFLLDEIKFDKKHLTWHDDKNQWCCGIGIGTSHRWSAYHERPEIAIALCVLRAKGVDV